MSVHVAPGDVNQGFDLKLVLGVQLNVIHLEEVVAPFQSLYQCPLLVMIWRRGFRPDPD